MKLYWAEHTDGGVRWGWGGYREGEALRRDGNSPSCCGLSQDSSCVCVTQPNSGLLIHGQQSQSTDTVLRC